MTFKDSFEYYSIIINFLEKTLGNVAEITLYSFENKKEGELISKSSNCDFELGSSAPKTLGKILEKYEKNEDPNLNFVTNFPDKGNDSQLFRVSVFFIRNDKKRLRGTFNIRIDISNMIVAANLLNELLKSITGGEERNIAKESDEVNELGTIEEYAKYVINQYFSSLRKPVDAMGTSEKIEVVKNLNQKGIFHVRGSVSELANRFNTSEKTIYRYLSTDEKNVKRSIF